MIRTVALLEVVVTVLAAGFDDVTIEFQTSEFALTATELACIMCTDCCGDPLTAGETACKTTGNDDYAVGTKVFDDACGFLTSEYLDTHTGSGSTENKWGCNGEACTVASNANAQHPGYSDGGLGSLQAAQDTPNNAGCIFSVADGDQMENRDQRDDCFNVAAITAAGIHVAVWNEGHQSDAHKCYWHGSNTGTGSGSTIARIGGSWFNSPGSNTDVPGYKECLFSKVYLDSPSALAADAWINNDASDGGTVLQGNGRPVFDGTSYFTHATLATPWEMADTSAPTNSPTTATPTVAPTTESQLCDVGGGDHPAGTDHSDNGVQCGGGVCPQCVDGKICSDDSDCTSDQCYLDTYFNNGYQYWDDDGHCADCDNDVKDGGETDVDCGGLPSSANCTKCAIHKDCKTYMDCVDFPVGIAHVECDTVTELDAAMRAAADPAIGLGDPGWCASCVDGVKNIDEVDVDCGGIVCPKCANGKICGDNNDCVSSQCHGGVCKECLDATTCVPAPGWVSGPLGSAVCDPVTFTCVFGTAAPTSAPTKSPTTAAPTESPTTAAPTKTMHLPNNWEYPDSDHKCTTVFEDESDIPHFSAPGTDVPYTVLLEEGDTWVTDTDLDERYTFHINIESLLMNPKISGNVAPYNGWIFFSDSVAERQVTDACTFDVLPHSNFAAGNTNNRTGIKAHSLAHHIAIQKTDFFDGDDSKDIFGVPYTLSATCGDTADELVTLEAGDLHEGELARKHTFAIHYVQCVELESINSVDCEDNGLGKILYNLWLNKPASGEDYDGTALGTITDSGGSSTPNWSDLFSVPDTFAPGLEYTGVALDNWLRDFFAQDADWTPEQINAWIQNHYLYQLSSGQTCTVDADCTADPTEVCSTGALSGLCLKPGQAATCIINSRSMELQYLSPSLADSNSVVFNTTFVYSPNVGNSEPITAYLISGNAEAAEGGGEIIPHNLLFTSCYHAPRMVTGGIGYEPHSHDFCLTNGLYSLNQNYLYAGMPYRFYFEFFDNVDAPANQNADELLNDIFDFAVTEVSFHLFENENEADTNANAKLTRSHFNCPGDELCGVETYNVQVGNGEPDYNAFEISGNVILDATNDIFMRTDCADCCSPVPCCTDTPCVLRMTFLLEVCLEDENCAAGRRRLQKQITTTIHNPHRSLSYESLSKAGETILQITTPSWNTQVIEVATNSSALDAFDTIKSCMAESGKLYQCDEPGICTDIEFVAIDGTTNAYQMIVAQNQMIETDVQEAINSCFAESDATPLNPSPTVTPTADNSNKNDILWIILATIGITSILLGIAVYLVRRFSLVPGSVVPYANEPSGSRFERARLVGHEKRDDSRLRFGTLL